MSTLALTSSNNRTKQRDSQLKVGNSHVLDVTPTNDASRALLHGSNRKTGVLVQDDCGPRSFQAELRVVQGHPAGFEPATSGLECSAPQACAWGPESNRHLLPLLIIAALLAFASGICQAQEPSAGPLIDRIETRLESARKSLDRSTAESKAWRERFDRVDRSDRGGKIGSRIGTFLDRIERIFWLVVIVFVVACVAVGLASAAYGIERMSSGASAVLGVFKSLADTLKAWKGKA